MLDILPQPLNQLLNILLIDTCRRHGRRIRLGVRRQARRAEYRLKKLVQLDDLRRQTG